MNEKWNLKIKIKLLKMEQFVRIVGSVFLFLLLSSSIYGQITVNVKNQTIKQTLKTIESKSDYKFFYNAKFAELDSKITLNVVNQSVESVMDKLLAGTQLTYEKRDNNQIVLFVKPVVNDTPVLSGEIKKVTGTVVDEQEMPVIGASISEKGTPNGTVTNEKGEFSINVSSNAVLGITYLGYIQQDVSVKNKTLLNIKLQEDIQKLNEVVVVGYGTQTRREITGSVTSVSAKDFNQGFQNTAADLLQGKVAGLTITTGYGEVTYDPQIRLRGVSTLLNDQGPFIVIDNVPGADLSSVAPQDIESISILKDASAAAIYGSRSAGGVILVTTKKGVANQPRISYSGSIGISTLANKPDVMTADQWRNYCATNGIDTSPYDMGANTDWFNEITRTGIEQSHSVSLSGGGTNHTYRGSLTYLRREGVARDNWMERYNSRFQFTQWALNNKLQVGLTGVATNIDSSPSNPTNFLLAYNMLPVYPVKNPDGTWFERRGEYDQGNPVENQTDNTRSNKTNSYYGTLDLSFKPIEGLELKGQLSKSRKSNSYKEYDTASSQAGYRDGGDASQSNSINDMSLMEWTANYHTEFKGNKIEALVGYSWEQDDYTNFWARNRNFLTDVTGANDLGAGRGLRPGDVGSGQNQSRLISFYGRINYSYMERYMLTATIRKDGSSKFGANNKWGTFPSLSAAWDIAQENSVKDIKWLNDLKISVGYGVTGNQSGLDPYLTIALYGSNGTYYDNGSWLTAYKISQNANPDLKWERTGMLNLALDFSLFDERLGGRLEWYNKKTSDMLYSYPVPTPPYLYSEMMANVGDMQNKGVEFTLDAGIIRTKDFKWDISLNLAHNANKITRLSNAVYKTNSILIGSQDWRGSNDGTTHIVKVGYPIGQFYGLKYEGLDKDGNYIFYNKDGKGAIKEPGDYTYIGNAFPSLTYGINNSFTYKRFDLSFFLRGTHGNDVLNAPRLEHAQRGFLPGSNALNDPLVTTLNQGARYSSLYVEDGSFLRLDNMSLGFRPNALKGNMRIYLTAQNLFVITKYKGLDPEVPIDLEDGLAPGVDQREFVPKARTFSIGLDLSF